MLHLLSLSLAPLSLSLSVHLYGEGAVARAGGQCEISVSQVSGPQSKSVEMQCLLFTLALKPASSSGAIAKCRQSSITISNTGAALSTPHLANRNATV